MNLDYDYDEVIKFCEAVAQKDIDNLILELNSLGRDLNICESKFHTIGTIGVVTKIYNGFSSIIGNTQNSTGLSGLALQSAKLFNIAYSKAMTDKNILENDLKKISNNNSSLGTTTPSDKQDSNSPLEQIPDDNGNFAGYSDGQNSSWDGPVLTRKLGVVQGPTGKETYYNLEMDRVVQNMKDMGFQGEYWVRDDGVKMFGDYVMVAANLDTFPRGSIVDCSLGKAIVCDTGTFAAENPTQLDIAVTW